MKQIALFFCLLFFSACGFTPMYSEGGKNAGAASALDQVDIALIPNAAGVSLRNELIDRFYQNGYPVNPRYHLSVSALQENLTDLDITIDSEATRRQLKLNTKIILTDTTNGETVLQRSLNAYSSYNIIGSQFTTRVVENDARDAAIADLARQIETQLSLYFNR